MKSAEATFKFKVPETYIAEHPEFPEVEKEQTRSFKYDICENDAEATAVIEKKKWSVIGMVNDAIKANARSNAYQNALMPYKPTEVSQDDIVERMVRDYIRLGLSEEQARNMVTSAIAK
jgi:hypothetical protein